MDDCIHVDMDIRQAPESGSPSESIAAPHPTTRQRNPRRGGVKGPDSGTGRTITWKTGTRAAPPPTRGRTRSLPVRTLVNNRLAIAAGAGAAGPPPSDRAPNSRQHSSQQRRLPRRPARTAIAGVAMARDGGRTPATQVPEPGPNSNGSSRRVASSNRRRVLPGTRAPRKVNERLKAKVSDRRRARVSGTRPIDEVPGVTGASPTRRMTMRQKRPDRNTAGAGLRVNGPPQGIPPSRSNGRDGRFGGRGGTNRPPTAWSRPGIRISGLAGKAAPAAM